MTLNRTRLAALAALGVASLLLAGVLCCARSESPAVQTAQPREGAAPQPAPPGEQEQPSGRPATADEATTDPAQPIDMDVPEEPQPEMPPYVEIVEQIKPAEPTFVNAEIVSPTKLVIETDNVRVLRITREGVPLARNRSIVLRIDDQGIEWTRKYIAVELERSPAGEWTVVRRRPAEP
jgi:hypothetical protein